MDYLNKSLSSGYKTLTPYKLDGPSNIPLESKLPLKSHSSNNAEFIYKNYAERDTFVLSNKLISPEEWDSISNILTNSTNFHTIAISGINIEAYGLKKLAECLSVNKYVKTLKLEWNYLNEYNEEFDYLCEVIARGNSIIYLHLNNNKLSSLQVPSLVKIIRSSNVLLQMDLRWNEIGNDGARDFILALGTNNILQELNLTGNKATQEILFEINERLSRNKNFYYNVNFNKESSRIAKLPEYVDKSQTNRSQYYTPYLNFFRDEDDGGKYMLEKEKEQVVEYKARYDSQLLNNANLEKRVKELEILLNNEKARADDYKSQTTKELQNEKDKIAKYEEEILRQKEEFLMKEMEWRKFISDLEGELTILNQEKNDQAIEITLLKEQLARQKESYEDKYKMLEDQMEKNNEYLNNNLNSLKLENERVRKDYEEMIRKIHLDWDRKYKNSEEQIRINKSLKEELEKENSGLKKELTEFKLNKEIELREREGRLLEEENRKLDNTVKLYEGKFRAFEFYKEEINGKYSKLLEEVEALRKTLSEESSAYEKNVRQLTSDNNNLGKVNNNLTQNISKLNAEISIKEGLINKLKSDLCDVDITLKDDLFSNNSKIEELVNVYSRDKQSWEKERQELNIKCGKLENLVDDLKARLDKKAEQMQKLVDNLKSQVSKHIEEKFKEKYKI